LGAARTLTLVNGRRHVAGIQGTGTVDVNTISTSLLQSVEILTGGASALYGADAVSGAVNFNMRSASTFDGVEIRTQTGVTDEGDANEFVFSIANGFASDDGKGDLVFGIDYVESSAVLSGARDFAGDGQFSQVTNAAAFAEAFGIDPRFANAFVPNQTLPISSGSGVISLTGSGFGSVFGSGGVPGCSLLGAAQIPECQTIGADGF
jgi:outer membrane receptor protein involved in Fe transport